MDFLNSIQCKKEPFASTAGEDLFISQPIRDSLEKLTHSIRLGGGLHVVVGREGTGKSTLVRQLSDKFKSDKNTIVLTISNPQFSNLQQFVTALAGAYKRIKLPPSADGKKLQQAFNSFFYKMCQQEKKTVLLLIDNGHTLPDFCLQALNELYDHLAEYRRQLQTVICGAKALQQRIKSIKSLHNRVVFTIDIKPFRFKDTREIIEFHLTQAAADSSSPPALFSIPSQWAIHRLAQGEPRKITDICHFIVLTLVIENRKKADWFTTLRCARLLFPKRAKHLQLIRAGSLASLIVLMLVFGLWSEQIKDLTSPQVRQITKAPVAEKITAPKPKVPQEKEPAPEIAKPVTAQPELVKEASPPKTLLERQVEPPLPAPELVDTGAVPRKITEVPPEEIAAAPPEEIPQVAVAEVREQPVIREEPVVEQITEEPVEVLPQPEPVAEAAAVVTPAIKEQRKVMPGDTFLVMIQKVYGPGHLKPHFIEQVLAANPQLKKPDNLEVGDEIIFPVFTRQKEKPAVVSRKTESLVAKKLDRDLQPAESPGVIGSLTVQPGDTLGALIRGIYGPFSFNPDYTAEVLAANTHLKNPDSLEVGETVYFPDLPIRQEIGLPAKPVVVASRGVLPEFLGEIIAIEDETFGDMVRRIYGPYSFNKENVAKVLAVNPGLKNPDTMSVGQKIRFPTILVALTSEAEVVWWVKIITLDNLQSAYRFLRVYSKWTPPMLIIPSRNDN
ncbi:MAG: AAA family ATPase, partial [Desulfobulbales bacterium]|nr:AAA family ATPase [Desulfobulbales bacterium]